MVKSILDNEDKDAKARFAIWGAICIAASDIRHRFAVGAIYGINESLPHPNEIPNLKTSRLVEALSLLCVILSSSEAKTPDPISLFGKTGPVEIQEDGVVRYLWAQQTLRGDLSGHRGLPVIIVTSSSKLPHPDNANHL